MAASDWSSEYTSALLNVIPLVGRLSLTDTSEKVGWAGSDATPTTCAAVDRANLRYAVFDYQQCDGYLSDVTGLKVGDFLLIALAEYLSLV